MTPRDTAPEDPSETPREKRELVPFPEAGHRTKGYEKRAVDAFLARARAAFEATEQGDADAATMTSTIVRSTAFPLVRHGYSIPAVDTALSRVEDAFAARERGQVVTTSGASEWVARTRESAQVILDRLTRPPKHRFQRAGFGRYGYRIDEVDLVADKIARYLEEGEQVTVEQVRAVAFRMQRRGYREDQVDAVLDAVVEVMLAVR